MPKHETVADIVAEIRTGAKPFPFVYRIGRSGAPAQFDAKGRMIAPPSMVIDDVTADGLADRIEAAANRDVKRAIMRAGKKGSKFCMAKGCRLRRLAEAAEEGGSDVRE